jgi:transposase-like protein
VKYSNGFKARTLQRLAGPDRVSATSLAEELGVCQSTLSRWLREAREEAKRGNRLESTSGQVAGARSVSPKDLPAAEKLRLVLEAARVPQDELGAFLRSHGLHEAQLEEWRKKVEEAALGALGTPRTGRPRRSPEARQVQALERELARKDKALAEVTALLALKKKLERLLGDEDDDTGARSER